MAEKCCREDFIENVGFLALARIGIDGLRDMVVRSAKRAELGIVGVVLLFVCSVCESWWKKSLLLRHY